MVVRVGSLCSGYGGLDLAVEDVIPGAELAWCAQFEPPDKKGRPDRHQHAAKIMAHHWPGVPNHGDITQIDYTKVEQVDIVTAGFPCTDLSLAGGQAGLMPGTRSGVWSHVSRAIGILRPRLVVIENVRSITSARAHCDLEFCPRCMGAAGAGRGPAPDLRALGRVLGDLAGMRFDAQWTVVRASDVGAPHRRERAFVLAWPADAEGEGLDRWCVPALAAGAAGQSGDASGPAVRDADRESRKGRRITAPGQEEGGRTLADPGGRGGEVAPDAQGDGRHEGRTESARVLRGPDAAERGGASSDGLDAWRDELRRGLRSGGFGGGCDGAVAWGEYEPAVRRWECILGRPAPRPVNEAGRLAPAFVEWMMGLPEGWVSDVPGIPRSGMLKALGNGVVPQQAAHALRMLIIDVVRESGESEQAA